MRPTSAVQLAAVCCAVIAPSLRAQTAGRLDGTVRRPRGRSRRQSLRFQQELRAGAAVLGYSPQNKLVSLRAGQNDMICLAQPAGGYLVPLGVLSQVDGTVHGARPRAA